MSRARPLTNSSQPRPSTQTMLNTCGLIGRDGKGRRHRDPELVFGKRLGENQQRAERLRLPNLLDVLEESAAGNDDDRHLCTLSAERADQLEAGHVRHGEVSHHEVRGLLTPDMERRYPLSGLAYVVPQTRKHPDD